MKRTKILAAAALCLLAATIAASAQIASSANFTLEKAAVSSGGGTSAGPTYSVSGTAGQAAAGPSAGTNFSVQNGFWSAAFAPTASNVSIEGRVMTPAGRGLRNAVVYLTDAAGRTVAARTSTFGYYRFEGIAAGQTVIVGVNSKLYEFTPRLLTVDENLTGIDFTPAGQTKNDRQSN